MKNLINFLLFATATFLLSGCANTGGQNADQPTAQQIDSQPSTVDKTISFLEKESTKKAFKEDLVFAGTQIMDWFLTPEDKKAIAAQLWTWSVIFNSLQTGEYVTPEKLGDAMMSSAVHKDAASVARIVQIVQYGWKKISDKIQLAGAPQIGVEYLGILSQTAQQVAQTFDQ